jgi:hypothetical protein
MRFAGHVARMEEMKEYKISVGQPEGKYHSEDVGIHVRIILKWFK